MKRSRKIVSWIVGVLLTLVIVLVVVIALFDWNRLKPFIDDKVSQAIGRPFAINGDLTVAWKRDRSDGFWRSLVPTPEFTARNITVANPTWASQPRFAQLDALRFRLSPLPLLAHRITVPTMQLVHPTIDLERDKQARATWAFDFPQSNAPSTWKLDLREIGFDRGSVSLDDAASTIKLQVAIEPLQGPIPYDQIVAQQSSDARAQAGSSADASAKTAMSRAADKGEKNETVGQANSSTAYLFGWQATGSYKTASIRGSGKTGGVLALQNATDPFPVQADVHIGDSHIALVGTLTDPANLGALDVRLWFSGSSMAKLYAITGVTLPDTPPYSTEGHLKAQLGKASSHFSYQNFRGRVGGSDLAGSLDYASGGARPTLSGTIRSQLLQFADLAPLIGADSNAEKQQRGDGTMQPTDKALPVEPFRTDRWKAMDADVRFSAAHISHGPSLPIESLNTHLVMTNGLLQLDPLNFGLAGGNVTSRIHLDGGRTPMQGTLRLGARHLKLKQLFPEFAPMQTSFGEINGDADLTLAGNSVAALLGQANGELKLLVNDGAISKTLLETAGLNVGNIVIGKLFGDKTVKINCAASDLVATNGVFDARLFVFDTADATINVDGTVNMATEALKLDVVPHTKGFRIFSLRSPLYVKGTLKNPNVGVQPGPLILRGGGAVALAVVAAPVAALLALVSPNRNAEGENTCRMVLEQMNKPSRANAGQAPIKPQVTPHK
ncbi:AsmA family protein [Rhodanobacter sp. L36]|uniref:AsmA family protein n=1 Tax=Rhodanobacter sp. L36 TaxID=1747221 RepID=UPI00131C1A90|nr:AsmA family protein [Rhodanobacter sp. L36]